MIVSHWIPPRNRYFVPRPTKCPLMPPRWTTWLHFSMWHIRCSVASSMKQAWLRKTLHVLALMPKVRHLYLWDDRASLPQVFGFRMFLQNVGSSDRWFAGCDGRVHTSCVRIKERPCGRSNSSRWRVGQKIAWSQKITGRTRFQGFSTTHIGFAKCVLPNDLLVISRLLIGRLGNSKWLSWL